MKPWALAAKIAEGPGQRDLLYYVPMRPVTVPQQQLSLLYSNSEVVSMTESPWPGEVHAWNNQAFPTPGEDVDVGVGFYRPA